MRYAFLTDLHYGYERAGGKTLPLHDPKAMEVTLEALRDLRPDVIILGGDILDCGAISHWNEGKPRQVESLRFLRDLQECQKDFIAPLESLGASKLVYIKGNHERFVEDLLDRFPGLEGAFSVEEGLKLGAKWKVIPVGGAFQLDKLVFIHGDQIRGTARPSKWAVEAYEKNIRFGHFHRYEVTSKISALDNQSKTGISVPCLMKRSPAYQGGAPNRWQQGFLWGDSYKDAFWDQVAIIVNGKVLIGSYLYSAA
jgi:predicted phosphodiesterase